MSNSLFWRSAVAMVFSATALSCSPPQRLCVPGEVSTCSGPGLCIGSQACNSAGNGYGVCSCGGFGGGIGAGGGAGGGGGGGALTGGGGGNTGGGGTGGGNTGGGTGGGITGGGTGGGGSTGGGTGGGVTGGGTGGGTTGVRARLDLDRVCGHLDPRHQRQFLAGRPRQPADRNLGREVPPRPRP